MKMLIGIDYTQDGSRTISHLEADIMNDVMKQAEILAILENKHDEVYAERIVWIVLDVVVKRYDHVPWRIFVLFVRRDE